VFHPFSFELCISFLDIFASLTSTSNCFKHMFVHIYMFQPKFFMQTNSYYS
jgi:hypothetical protein